MVKIRYIGYFLHCLYNLQSFSFTQVIVWKELNEVDAAVYNKLSVKRFPASRTILLFFCQKNIDCSHSLLFMCKIVENSIISGHLDRV